MRLLEFVVYDPRLYYIWDYAMQYSKVEVASPWYFHAATYTLSVPMQCPVSREQGRGYKAVVEGRAGWGADAGVQGLRW